MKPNRMVVCLAMCLSAVSAQTPKPKPTFKGPSEGITSLAFSPNAKLLAVAGEDNTVTVWEVASGRKKLSLRGQSVGGGKVAFSTDGTVLAFREGRFYMSGLGPWGAVTVWDAAGKRKRALTDFTFHGDIALSPDGSLLALTEESLDGRGLVEVREAGSGKAKAALKEEPQGKGPAIRVLGALAFSPDGAILAYSSHNRWGQEGAAVVKFWEVRSGKTARTVKVGAGTSAMTFGRSGELLACGGKDGTVRVLDVKEGKPKVALKGHTDPVAAVAFAGTDKVVAVSRAGVVKVWDLSTGKEVASREKPYTKAKCVALSGDGKLVAWAAEGGTVRVFDVPDGKGEGGR